MNKEILAEVQKKLDEYNKVTEECVKDLKDILSQVHNEMLSGKYCEDFLFRLKQQLELLELHHSKVLAFCEGCNIVSNKQVHFEFDLILRNFIPNVDIIENNNIKILWNDFIYDYGLNLYDSEITSIVNVYSA